MFDLRSTLLPAARRGGTLVRASLVMLAAHAASAGAQAVPVAPHASVLSLHDVLDSALARHPLAEAARARVRAARGMRTSAGALGNPVLSYDVENAPFPRSTLKSPMDRETMTTATLPLESIAQRFPRARRADAEVRAAEADARGVGQQLALDASRVFFQTALAQVRIEIARDLTTWLDSVVTYNRMRVEEGIAAEADLIRAELERDRAEAQLTMYEAEHARTRADLAAFLGNAESPGSHIVVAVDDVPMRLPSFADSVVERTDGMYVVPSSVLRTGVDRRPDVRAARERLVAAGSGISVERFSIVRELGATLGTKRTAGTTSMMAGLSMPLPLFDPNRGEIARASAERDAAAFELAARERTARAELAGAYEAARLLTARASLLVRPSNGRHSFLARADEARRIALGAYREGAVPLLQVIDAARAWGEARLAFYETLTAQHESVALLLVAHGDDLFTTLPALRGAQPTSR